MRWLSLALIILLLAPALVPCVIVAAQPTQIPHEDPSASQSTLDSLSFLSQYAQILSLTASGDYENASQLNELLSHITVPDDLKYIVDRYSNLTQQLINVLHDLDGTLNNASRLLDQNRLGEAKQTLDQAGVFVAKAQIILGDLKDATATLSQRLGVFSASAASQVRDAYNTLQGMLQRLQDLIDLYHQLLSRTIQRMEETDVKHLTDTSLTLNLNTTSSFVGSYLVASGALTANGSALSNREVVLYLDDGKVASASTDVNGAYSTLIRIPYKYVSYVTVYALYSPQSGDKDVYLGSVSADVKVQVLFYRTLLQVALPSVTYPGLSLNVNGNVTSEEGLPLTDRQIKLALDGQIILQATTGSSGDFSFNTKIAAQEKLGVHSLTVTVGSSGLYNSISVQGNMTVKKMASTLQISAPSTVILPSGLFVNGTIRSASGPLVDASVAIRFADTTVNVKSLRDGTFNATVDIPFSTVFAGNQKLTVVVVPNEPWQASAQQTTDIFVLNSVSLGIAVACSLSVVLVMYFRLAGHSRKRGQKAVEAASTFAVPTEEITAQTNQGSTVYKMKFEGLRGRVLKAYAEALNLVQSVTGEGLMPNMTFREFLQLTKAKLGEAADSFLELTLLAEKSLYSQTDPVESEAEKAEDLANKLRRTMNGRSA
ncbi:hypothetical protein GX563_03265 [Candidatus Bathyarchaeota archaeon]|nr:hypothetical protein [Candidatus Bathyarchaeota archaeon]